MARGERSQPGRRRGVGLFGCVTWGWAITLALLLLVGVTLAIGWLVNDPARNPAPADYPPAACEAFRHLEGATLRIRQALTALEEGDDARAATARSAAERSALAGSDASSRLPEWGPGEPFTELLASLIVATLNGADALADDDLAGAREELATAEELVGNGRRALGERRFGFQCTGGGAWPGPLET